jgi:hypothetical protein
LDKTKYVDSIAETELAKLIILIMNTQSAAEHVIRENELVMKNIIVLVLGSNNNTMKIMVRFLNHLYYFVIRFSFKDVLLYCRSRYLRKKWKQVSEKCIWTFWRY